MINFQGVFVRVAATLALSFLQLPLLTLCVLLGLLGGMTNVLDLSLTDCMDRGAMVLIKFRRFILLFLEWESERVN